MVTDYRRWKRCDKTTEREGDMTAGRITVVSPRCGKTAAVRNFDFKKLNKCPTEKRPFKKGRTLKPEMLDSETERRYLSPATDSNAPCIRNQRTHWRAMPWAGELSLQPAGVGHFLGCHRLQHSSPEQEPKGH